MPNERYDQDILDEAMRNAFSLLTGKFTFEGLMDLKDELPLPFNIEEEDPDYDVLIEYFIETEEYEKCAELVKLKNESVQ